MKKSGSSSHAGSIVALQQALHSYGIDGVALANEAGIEATALRDMNSRIPEELNDTLILKAIEATGDPTFGLRFVDYVHPTSYHALGLALLSSDTLRDFAERFTRYFALINTTEKVTFKVCKDYGVISDTRQTSVGDPAVQRCHEDAFLALIVKFIRLMYQPNYIPLAIKSTSHKPDINSENYKKYFGVDMEFDAEVSAIHIAYDDLDVKLPAANASLAQQNDQVVVDFLATMSKVDLPSQVNLKLIKHLPSGDCCKEQIAKDLNMSPRALHNKLEKAGTSYQELLDSTRQQLAEQYMKQKELSVSEIAYLLGFTDSSNFSRAFKRWSGFSPSDFRNRN